MANSKIDSYDREILKNFKAENPNVCFHNNEETTIVFKDNSNCNTVEFALSVMSPDEKKFRRKVGEYFAMCRFQNCETVKMKRDDFYAMMTYLYSW